MKVLVVGSWAKESAPQGTAPRGSIPSPGSGEPLGPFVRTCRDLGAALARAGHELIVGSEEAHTADAHAAIGAGEAAKAERRQVRCWFLPRVAPSGPPFADQPGLEVIVKNPTRSDWESVSARQVELADGVITVCGSRRTRTAAYLAMAQRKPLVAIASQRGASEIIAEDVRALYAADPDMRLRLDDLSTKIEADEARAAVALLADLAQQPPRRRPRLPATWFLLLLALLLLAGWVRVFTGPWPAGAAAFFLLAALAALSGTVLRNVLRVVFDPTADVTWTRLQHDSAAGVLLGFLLLLVYLTGAQLVAGEAQSALPARADDHFQQAAIVVSLLGTTGGLLIEEAAERLRKLLTDRLQTPN